MSPWIIERARAKPIIYAVFLFVQLSQYRFSLSTCRKVQYMLWLWKDPVGVVLAYLWTVEFKGTVAWDGFLS